MLIIFVFFSIIFAVGTWTYALSFLINGPLVDRIGGKKGIIIASGETELIPNAKFTVLERCPHGANVERAPEFNSTVLDFVAEHTPARV